MKKHLCIVAFCALALSSLGCRSTIANTVEISPKGKPVVQVMNSGLNKDVTIDAARANYIGDIMEVVVSLKNLDDRDHAVEYLCKWFEEGDYAMNDEKQTWITFFIAAGETKQLKIISPGAGATNCRVLVRYGKTD